MTISLTKPAAGSVGWAGAINQNWTDIENRLNSQLLSYQSQGSGLSLSYSVTGGTLSATGDTIVFFAEIHATADFGIGSVSVSYGGTTIFTEASADAGGELVVHGAITRTGSSSQDCVVYRLGRPGSSNGQRVSEISHTDPAKDNSSSQTLTVSISTGGTGGQFARILRVTKLSV